MTENEEFEAILDVFTQPGWKLIEQDMIDLLAAVERIDDINSEQELFRRKGEAERLRWFIALKEWYQISYETNLRIPLQ